MSDSINEQRCPWHGSRDCSPLLNGCSWRPGPSVVTPPRRRVNGHALCTEPSGVPSRACEMYEGHDGPHRLMPAVVTPPAQDDPLCYWTGHDCLCGASAVMSYEQRRETCHGRRVPVPAAPSVSTDHTDEIRDAIGRFRRDAVEYLLDDAKQHARSWPDDRRYQQGIEYAAARLRAGWPQEAGRG